MHLTVSQYVQTYTRYEMITLGLVEKSIWVDSAVKESLYNFAYNLSWAFRVHCHAFQSLLVRKRKKLSWEAPSSTVDIFIISDHQVEGLNDVILPNLRTCSSYKRISYGFLTIPAHLSLSFSIYSIYIFPAIKDMFLCSSIKLTFLLIMKSFNTFQFIVIISHPFAKV